MKVKENKTCLVLAPRKLHATTQPNPNFKNDGGGVLSRIG